MEQAAFKHHSIPYRRFRYPVGKNMMENESAFRDLIDQFLDTANDSIISHDKIALICMGSSGSIVSTLMYMALRSKHPGKYVEIVHIKKDGESSHSTKFQGIPDSYQPDVLHVWIDDHIDQGTTVSSCLRRYRDNSDTYSDFKFDWAVCLSSEYSINEAKQLTFFETFTKNMFCNISHHCDK